MQPIGSYQSRLQYQDGLYQGFLAKAATGLNIKVAEGLAQIGGKLIERDATAAAADVAIPAADGVHSVYLNHPDAVNGAGAAIGDVTVDVKEADVTRDAINGSKSTMKGRSFLLAEVTVSGGAITKVDNTVRLQTKNIPAALATQQVGLSLRANP